MKNYKPQGTLLQLFGLCSLGLGFVVYFNMKSIESSLEQGWLIADGLIFSLFGISVISFILGGFISKRIDNPS